MIDFFLQCFPCENLVFQDNTFNPFHMGEVCTFLLDMSSRKKNGIETVNFFSAVQLKKSELKKAFLLIDEFDDCFLLIEKKSKIIYLKILFYFLGFPQEC